MQLVSPHPQAMAAFLMLILLVPPPLFQTSAGTSSPQSLKKILSLSEEGNERHRRQAEDTVSNASSQLSSPPTSPQSSPKKGKPIIPHPSLSMPFFRLLFPLAQSAESATCWLKSCTACINALPDQLWKSCVRQSS